MGISRIHFSSATDAWSTPAELFRALDEEFGFNFDPCPLNGSEDGTAPLFCSWAGKRMWINPPYGPGIRPFLDRWREPELAVYLLPARTDVKWFHEIVLPHACEIRFVKGRLKFGGSVNPAPFPSMIVVFKGETSIHAKPSTSISQPEHSDTTADAR